MQEDIKVIFEGMDYDLVIKGSECDKFKIILPIGEPSYDKFKLTINSEVINSELKSDKYVIRRGYFSKKIKLIIPMGGGIDLDANIHTGNLSVKGLMLCDTNIISTLGNVTIKNSYSEDIYIKGNGSKVTLINVPSDKCFIETVCGDVKLYCSSADSTTTVKTETGSIEYSDSSFNMDITNIKLSYGNKEQLFNARYHATRNAYLNSRYGKILVK